jgi:hypothetical protein
MINADTVLRPYIGIPDFDRKWDYHATSKKYLLQKRYWGIRYATTDRGTGYGNASIFSTSHHRFGAIIP